MGWPSRSAITRCPGNYIVGQVLNAAGAPVAGVRIIMVDQWGNRADAWSKDSAGDYGRYDFPINFFPNHYTLAVLDQADTPSARRWWWTTCKETAATRPAIPSPGEAADRAGASLLNPPDASQAVERCGLFACFRRIFLLRQNHLWYDRVVCSNGAFLLAEGCRLGASILSFILCATNEQPRVP